MGSDHDIHSMRWQGNSAEVSARTAGLIAPTHTTVYRGQVSGERISATLILPATSMVVDMDGSNPGTWKIDCDVVDHRLTGMNALYTVSQVRVG